MRLQRAGLQGFVAKLHATLLQVRQESQMSQKLQEILGAPQARLAQKTASSLT